MKADAFEEFFELHFDVLYGYLARRVGPDLGGELASETFARALAARKRYDAALGEARPWLFGIANNLLRRHYRDEERRLRAFARVDVRGDEQSPPARRHSMDELALLRRYRLVDASPDRAREQARSALRAVLARQRRRRRRLVVAAAFAGAAILAGAAYGIARELVVGDPAPPGVRAQARLAHSAELIPVPHPDDPQLRNATIAAVLESSVGRVYLFASRNARGPCVSTWVEGSRGYRGRLALSTACGDLERTVALWGQTPARGKTAWLLAGQTPGGVRRLTVRLGSRTVDVPLSRGRWFLAEIPNRPDAFTTYSARGAVLEHHRLPPLRERRPAAPIPRQVSRAREVASIDARHGTEQVSLLVARASNGGYCQIVRSAKTPSNRGCGLTPPKPREIAVSAMSFGGAPGGILLMVGPVGRDITRLELRYQDGRVVTIPLHQRWALSEVDPADHAPGRRPEALVGRDATGKRIATKRVAWAYP